MRGFRLIGKMSTLIFEDYAPDDLLHFAPDVDGLQMRAGWSRARNFDLKMLQSLIANGVCIGDYVFVATAIGEDCFK